MQIELDDEDRARIVRALEHFIAYLKAVQREDARYDKLLDRVKGKA